MRSQLAGSQGADGRLPISLEFLQRAGEVEWNVHTDALNGPTRRPLTAGLGIELRRMAQPRTLFSIIETGGPRFGPLLAVPVSEIALL